MKYIDHSGQGHTLLVLTDAESRLIRTVLGTGGPSQADWSEAAAAFNRGIQRGTERMAEESKAEWKGRAKK